MYQIYKLPNGIKGGKEYANLTAYNRDPQSGFDENQLLVNEFATKQCAITWIKKTGMVFDSLHELRNIYGVYIESVKICD